jgi:ubiquinone biosynthesis protein Coq4
MASKAQDPVAQSPVAMPTGTAGRVMDAAESRYMQGDRQPATSSVLISNSKYLNSPLYRDAFMQSALRRHGHDLPPTYTIPAMVRAIDDVTDHAEIARLIAEEKVRNSEFGAWVDSRHRFRYRAEALAAYADGTLGAAIRAFLATGMDMEFMKGHEAASDLQYIVERRATSHDIEHMVTGFGPNSAGEQALALCNVASIARFFAPILAQYFSHHTSFVSIAGFTRATLHYHAALPTYMEAMQKGIAAGLALKKPLFLMNWDDYLDWRVEDIAAELGFDRGPGDAWDWTTEATCG